MVQKKKKDVLLGDFLVQQGLITPDQLQKALAHQKEMGNLLGRSLIDLGFLEEKELIQALSDQLGVEYVSLKNYPITPQLIQLIPENIARTFKVLPLFINNNTLTLAMINPLDVVAIDVVSRTTGLKVTPVGCTEKEAMETIELYYQHTETVNQQSLYQKNSAMNANIKENGNRLQEEASDPSVVQWVEGLLQQAITERVSHIHVEPLATSLRVRYRIDGLLHSIDSNPKEMQQAVATRIKILAGIDPLEKAFPQTGKIQMTWEQRDVEFHVSIFPALHGESIVIKVSEPGRILNLEDLGLSERMLEKIKRLLSKPQGIIWITGSTGSGKTTTLYASLLFFESEEKNILTLEESITFKLDAIKQFQVNPATGFTTLAGLEKITDQDPDILMVDEVLGGGALNQAVKLALSGCLVLTIAYAHNLVQALSYLNNLKVDPYLLASATVGIVSQRLVRKICPQCKETYQPDPELLQALNVKDANEMVFYHGTGCEQCRNRGYLGRTAIFEMLLMDEEVRYLIVRKAPPRRIREVLRKKGMKTFHQDGMEKVTAGLTSIEELIRAIKMS